MNELMLEGYGMFVGSRNGYLYIRTVDGKETLIPPSSLSSVMINGESIKLSVKALQTLSRFGVDVTIMKKGKPVCKVLPAMAGCAQRTRIEQLRALSTEKCLEIAKSIIKGKLHNQRLVIHQKTREYKLRDPGLSSELEVVESMIRRAYESIDYCKTVDEVRAYEAFAAKNYWHGFSLILPQELGFRGRCVRDPQDPFNMALNIGYGILRSKVWSAVLLAGLDPYVGFLHVKHGRHMCLVSDLMEEFRPAAVDRPLMALALHDLDQVMAVARGERRPIFSKVIEALRANENALGKAIFSQARKLASFIRGDVEVYEPFKLKW